MSERSKIILIAILILILVVPAAAFGWNMDNDEKRFIRGSLFINGMPIGGQEAAAVRVSLEEKCAGFKDTQVQFSYLDKQWLFSFEDLGVSLEWEKAFENALELGRKGSFQQRFKERWKAVTEGQNITIPVNFDRALTMEKLQPIQKSVVSEARDARYLYHNNEVEITPHVYGRELNLDGTVEMLVAASQEEGERIIAAPPSEKRSQNPITISLPVEMSYPKVTARLLKEKTITHVAGSYATSFNTGQVGRSKNIYTAAKYLDGYVIPPGAAFSFNEVVGPRTKEAGFEEALIIVDDQFAPGLGGGVCQVSSTLYNTALRTGLKITERTRHSKVIHYVPVGLDAAVSYGYLDLKFINDTDSYIVVCAEAYNGTINFQLLIERANPFSIEVRSFIESTVKPRTEVREDVEIPEGKQYIESPGKNGHIARVERVWYQDGKEVRRETISRDFYPAEARVIVKGGREREVVKPEDKSPDSKAPDTKTSKSNSKQQNTSSESPPKNLDNDQQTPAEEKVPQEDSEEPSLNSDNREHSTGSGDAGLQPVPDSNISGQ